MSAEPQPGTQSNGSPGNAEPQLGTQSSGTPGNAEPQLGTQSSGTPGNAEPQLGTQSSGTPGNAEPQLGTQSSGTPGNAEPQLSTQSSGTPGNAEPQLGTQSSGTPGNAEPQLGTQSSGTPGNAEPQLGTQSSGTPGNAEPQLGTQSSGDPKAWYSRGYLPHWDHPETIQSITFRLADSLPRQKLEELEAELSGLPNSKAEAVRRRRIESWLDAGLGCCALTHPKVAQLMQETLLKWDGDRYRLFAWCIMPNHVHVLIEQHAPLGKIVQSWKSYTGRWALENNADLGLGVPGKAFWMREYWDRYIRNEDHFSSVKNYIEQNPVKARLCKNPEDWLWTSCGYRRLTAAP